MTLSELLVRVWSWAVSVALACFIGAAMAMVYWAVISLI